MRLNERLQAYHSILLQWQKTINLVSPNTLNDAWVRHFEDSLQIVDLIPDNVKTICDIGSGAGFPGLVIAIVRPNLQVNLIESDTRKCAFLRTVSRETKCENVTIHNGRIEDCLPNLQADCVSARALASLKDLLGYTRRQWTNNSALTLLLPKGRNAEEEIKEAEEVYAFDATQNPSKTDANAVILSVSNIRVL